MTMTKYEACKWLAAQNCPASSGDEISPDGEIHDYEFVDMACLEDCIAIPTLEDLRDFAILSAEQKYPPIDGMGRVQVGLYYKSKYLHQVYWATFEATDKSGKVCNYITKDGANDWWSMVWLIKEIVEK